ncbi:hypothetical protein HA402_003948 [Bradysia odoriphaga]|nr:hypothetical protein HA402_003948 [Bradysia odoriphaga]
MYVRRRGLLSWDAVQTHVDLEDELNTITVHAPEGEDARHGERLIQYASENLVTEILIHPQYNTLIQCMRNLLSSFTRHRHIIHAGYTFSGNGSWILQDGTFSVSDFAEAFQEHDVQRVLRAYPDTVSMDIHCDSSTGLWNVLPDKNYAKTCKIRINPVDVLESGSDRIKGFVDYLAPMLNPANLNDLLESSDVVGNIRFSHPTLYVFPGGQGDAALFGINGFNMLVDGGFNRKACFWNFARHLDRLDAVLMTRINNSNIQGIGSVIERKASSHVYPGIGHFFCNIPERRAISSPEENKDKDSLVIDLFDKGQKLVSNLKSISLKPQMCYRDVEPMNLYHKVGHGTLDMYVISPGKDSREVKEFMQKWTTNDQKLFTAKDTKDFQFPLQNLVSICALLVWQPANPEETITRILFPGSTPDYKIMEGLEKIKHLEFMKYPMCTAKKLVPSISTATITKKVLKSAINEKPIPEPILPSKTKSEKDNQVIDNKVKTIQDNRAKESKLIEEQTADKKAPIKARPKKIIPKKTDSLDEKQKDDMIENKEKDDETIDKPQVVINGTDIKETEQKDETDVTAKPKKIEPKSKTDTKVTIKSRIDSRPPKSMDKKVVKRDASEKKEVGKQSPTTTPKKTSSDPKLANGVPKEKEIKPRIVSRVTKSSPSSTPAKSTKEANNRKVLESKQKAKTVKREVVKTIEKKEEKVERKPISHRTKGISPSRRPPDSPKKSIKPKTEKDNIIRKAKLDKGGTTDSSLVSTPSADDAPAKKMVDVAIVDDVAKQRELDELKEEQEAVREIEEVFKREEKSKKKDDASGDHREVAKQDSATEAEDDEEYLIIEKEEVEQYTEDSINEQESSMAKEEEMQKHQRDSQESEKKRKSSLQTTEEEIEPKDGTEGEANVAEENGDQVEVVEQDKDIDDVQPDSIEDAAAVNKLEPAEEEHIKEEVQEIITSAKEIAKIKSESKEEVAKTEEMSSPTPEDKLSSTKKTSDTKDDLIQQAKDGEAPNLPESQPFSTTIESGATTAPTLPEDERIPLDEIKEDLVVEEKYIKEETKEAKEPEVPVSTVLQKTYEPLERAVPSKMHFDTTQPHLRDIVKTPDEEADIETYEGSEEAKDDKKATEKKPSDEGTKEEETVVVGTGEVDHKMKIPNGSVVNKVENEKLEHLQDLTEEEKNKEEHAAEEKEEDQASKPEDDKPIFDKKPEITGFKEKDSTMAKKVEYAVEDLGKNFETKLKDVTQKEDKAQSEKVKEIVAKDSDIQQQADETTETDVQVGKEDEKQSHEEPESSPKDDIKDFVDRAVSGVSSFLESTSKAITDKVESLVESAIIHGESEPESKEIPVDKEGIQGNSPVAEKDKIIDLKILDKLPEAIDEDPDEIIAKSMVPPFHPDDFKYASFERDDSNLKDIKEEEEEDRSSPPSNKQIASRKESTEISDLTNKDTITVVGLDEQPPRAVSPREEEVLKIVANVAEVLKSEKDIAEIIPDFSEEELEKKLRGASPRLDDESATVQRMLVTTSSEDGGEEIEICPEGTIKFSPVTPDVLSGKATPDIPKDVADVKSESDGKEGLEIHLEKQVEKDEKQASDPSTPEAKTSSISIDEKEKHEIPEKAQVDTKTEKVPEIVADKSIDESTSRKESVVSDFVDDVSDRRESAFSEKDFTKDESSIDGSRPPSSISNNLKVEKDEDEVTIETDIVVEPIHLNASCLSDKEDKQIAEGSRPASVASSKGAEEEPKEQIDVFGEKEKESRPVSAIDDRNVQKESRPESVSSSKSEQEASKDKTSDDHEKESRPASDNKEMQKDSRPESVTSSKDGQATPKDISDEKESRPTSAVDKDEHKDSRPESVAIVDQEVQKNSRPESVGSSKDGPTTPKDVFGDKESRPTSAVEKEEQKDSRPESVTSSKDEKEKESRPPSAVAGQEVHKDSRPESVTSFKDGQATDKVDKEEHKDSRPESVASSKNEIGQKEEVLPEKDEHKDSRPESVTSSKDGQATLKDKTDISSEKGKESRPPSAVGDKDEHKVSRPESAASSKEGQATPKDQTDISSEKEKASRPPSAAEDEPKDSRPESVTSSKSDKKTPKELDISGEKEKESRPVSVLDDEGIQKDSRPESVASSRDEQEALKEKTEERKESRPPSAIDDKEIQKDSRPESAASSKDGQVVSNEQIDVSGKKEQESRPASSVDKEHKDSRPESVASSKDGNIVPNEQTDVSGNKEQESRPPSAVDKEHKDSRPESVASSKAEKEAPKEDNSTEKEKESRPPSAVGDKDGHKDSRPESVANSDKQEIKEQTLDSRPLSAASTKDEKEASRPESVLSDKLVPDNISRPASVASSVGDQEENKETKDVHDSRTSSRSSFRDDKEHTRPQSSVSEKSGDHRSRPPSVASVTSDKIQAKDVDNVSNKSVEQDLRPPSATSCKSDKETTYAESDDKVKDSRSASVISSTDVKDVKLPKEKDDSRPPSTASHVSEKEVPKDIDGENLKDLRSPSVVSQLSDKPGNTEAKETSRPASVASSNDNKDTTRPESVLSDKREQDEVKTSRPPSSASHISDKVELNETKVSSRPASVASSKGDKDVTRPESILSDKLEQEQVKGSRPPSSASHISDKSVPNEAKESSRPSSVASSKEQKDVTPPESVSGKLEYEQKKDSRPPSAVSHVSDKAEVKEVDQDSRPASKASVEDNKDTLSEKSKPEHEQVKDSRPPSVASDGKQIDDTRSPSVASHASDKIETKQSQEVKDSRSPSVVSHVSDKPEVLEMKPDSRPPSSASTAKDDKSTRPESVGSDKSIKGEKSISRPLSAQSNTTDNGEVKLEETTKESRSQSIASRISDTVEIEEKAGEVEVTELQKSSRPSSVVSHVSEKDEVEKESAKDSPQQPSTTKDSRSGSVVSKGLEDISRPESALSGKDGKSKDSRPPSVNLNDKIEKDTKDEELSRPHSQSSTAPEEPKESSTADSGSLSGKSTPDVADIEKKILEETTTHQGETSKQTDVTEDHDFDHISITEKVSKTIEVTTAMTTQIQSTSQSSESHTTTTTSSSETQSESVVKDGAVNKDVVTTIKTEFRSYTPSSDDFDIHETNSPRSDVSAGHIARVVCGWTGSDDDITNSPLSTTSQAPCSPPSKFTYETEYELQRSKSARSSSDHRFLDEADLDFEKALEEHRQVRGSDVMSSVTSKYEFSPSKEPLESGKSTEFPLSGVQKGKSFDAKPDQPTTSEVQTKTEEEILKEEVEARVLSWGKPLGLPSPVPVENQTTPKRERKLMISKTKMNNEKNLRKRSESPIKGKKVTPIYMDLTYVPHNGNSYYSHVEFFKRIRARYYVFSGTEPSRDVYNALLEAKQTWEDKELEVTIIPTYDTDVLGYWVSENEDLLAKCRIDLSPSASRCTINLQDHETSCSAYRLEF